MLGRGCSIGALFRRVLEGERENHFAGFERKLVKPEGEVERDAVADVEGVCGSWGTRRLFDVVLLRGPGILLRCSCTQQSVSVMNVRVRHEQRSRQIRRRYRRQRQEMVVVRKKGARGSNRKKRQ